MIGDNFTVDVKNALENILVSFKQNTRVINKATNYYEKYIERNGEKVKAIVKQEGINWAIRKPLHKETVSGKVQLDRIKVAKGKILTATRKSLGASFNEKAIASITDTGIQKILLNYLKSKGGNPEVAFSPEGIEEMNQNIVLYNDGKQHHPILKVRVFEQGSKFALGESGNKTDKYEEAAKGTNLFFGIYVDKEGKHSYDTIPLNIVIERQKQGLPPVPDFNEKGHRLLFSLSPNDLVYVLSKDELESNSKIDFESLTNERRRRIYKMVSCTGGECHFVQQIYASPIMKKECGTNNKSERLMQFFSNEDIIGNDNKTLMIKENSIKLNVDRLGNISELVLFWK